MNTLENVIAIHKQLNGYHYRLNVCDFTASLNFLCFIAFLLIELPDTYVDVYWSSISLYICWFHIIFCVQDYEITATIVA